MNRNKLKAKVIITIQEKGITNYESMCLSIPEEKYILSIASLLRTINPKKIDQFLVDFEKVVLRKNIPLLSMDTVMLLYTRWLKYPDSCNVIIYFSKKMSRTIIKEQVIQTIIYKIHYPSNNVDAVLNRCFLVAQCFRKGIINHKESTEWLGYIKSIMSLHSNKIDTRGARRTSEGELLIQFETLFQWSELIKSRYPEDAEKRNSDLKKMIEKHFRMTSTVDKMDAKFAEFVKSLNQIVNFRYIFHYTTYQLFKIQEVYKVRPDLFTEEWLGIESCSDESILRTIFSKFKVSALFIQNFYVLNKKEKRWLIHLLKGKTLRTAKELPLQMTRKATNEFLKIDAGVNLTIKEGLVYASLLSLGVEKPYAYEVTNNIRNYRHAEFWVKHMSQFFFKGLSVDRIGDVMDYMAHVEFQENKGINWKQKNVANLVKKSDDWHTQNFIQKSFRNRRNLKFKSSSIEDFSLSKEDSNFAIKQLKSGFELFEEGKTLNHCVYSYQDYCKRGESEIFSLRKVGADETEKPLLTIEVRMGRIVQVRGNYNRSPKQNEWEIIKFWAGEQSLKIAC